jgi:hypothetical protein
VPILKPLNSMNYSEEQAAKAGESVDGAPSIDEKQTG